MAYMKIFIGLVCYTFFNNEVRKTKGYGMYTLKDISLFSKLNESQRKDLHAHMYIHRYDKDSIVFYEGDQSAYVYILLEGRVKLYKTSPKGTQVHMHYFEAPEMIALFATFEQIPFPATCVLVTDGIVGKIPLKKIFSCMQHVPFSIALVSALTKRMKLLSELLHKETIYTTDAKIADILLYNPSVFERLKHTEIAAILNMTPETLSRILTKFKKEKLISISGHIVTVHQHELLSKVLITNHI